MTMDRASHTACPLPKYCCTGGGGKPHESFHAIFGGTLSGWADAAPSNGAISIAANKDRAKADDALNLSLWANDLGARDDKYDKVTPARGWKPPR